MSPVITQHIEMMPSALHGEKAVIAGTRIRVMDVYTWHVEMGKSAQQIVEEFPHLKLADIYAAMTYYWDNEEYMKEQMNRENKAAEEATNQNPPKLPEAIKRRKTDGNSFSS
ncbi:DUF433 domain-containing protein [Bythopirellula goksoeyrii]|uniref:DUF433 domain-containing protein n=1 Tax=Bythopirellula goksoeyrii TaxID=1400387 RepID=A0A5B9Q3D3_9BACT|nr:DUF433 domain-containing protein [Bythopirellula goksoeyrii]QEG33538.1 hypothetical protein Pr1d_08020 [Bythopirellula goksoeyrii]